MITFSCFNLWWKLGFNVSSNTHCYLTSAVRWFSCVGSYSESALLTRLYLLVHDVDIPLNILYISRNDNYFRVPT